jgi:hypothetical protein
MIDQRRTEAGNAYPALVSNAGINDAGRSGLEQIPRQLLRCTVARRIERVGETRIVSDIVKLPPKVSQVVGVSESLFVVPVDLPQFFRLVKCNFNLRCSKQKSGVPSSPIGPVETASEGICVRECGVHNVGVGKPEHELMHGDPRQKAGLAGQALVGSALKFKQGGQFMGLRRQSVQYALLLVGGRDQSMSVILKNPRNRWNQLTPTPARIEQLSHPEHRGHAAPDQIGHGRVPFKHRIGIRQLHPTIG